MRNLIRAILVVAGVALVSGLVWGGPGKCECGPACKCDPCECGESKTAKLALPDRITTTDGKSYTRAADGYFYPSEYVRVNGAVAAGPVVSSPVYYYVQPVYAAPVGSCPGGSCGRCR